MTESRQTTLLGLDGLQLAADVAGDPSAPAVLLFHGGGQTRHSWRTTLDDLSERGFFVASVDLRGHGDSAWAPDGDYRIEAFGGDVAAVARQFDRPALVGASLGGTSSLYALGAEGDALARALVLVDVAPNIESAGAMRIGQFMREHMDTGFASLDEVADAVAAYNPHRPRPSNLEGLRKNVRRRDDGRWYWHWDPAFISGRFGSEDETRAVDESRVHRADLLEQAARSLTVPTLLVRGRQSDLLSEEGAHRFLELVPHAQFVDVAGAGHMVAGDRNDAFNQAVIAFLETAG
jgi:pimeloyl-ACP methyl ester carboxylesterase